MTENGNDSGSAGQPRALTDRGSMALALKAAGVGLWEWRAGEKRAYLDPQGQKLLGLDEPDAGIAPEALLRLFHPEDGWRLREAICGPSGGEIAQEIRLKPEGDQDHDHRWICVTGQTMRLPDGEGAAGVCYDVSERHRRQETADLVARELNHRMKNLFSVVNSIAAVSAEQRPEVQNFVSAFQLRINSLAAAYQLLREGTFGSVPLALLAEMSLSPLAVLPQITIAAGEVSLRGQDVQSLVLALHELATNALKYGALSTPKGRVKLSFDTRIGEGQDGAPEIVMTWQESGGPPVTPPTQKGFGLTLLERLSRRQRSMAPLIEWRAQGLYCQIAFKSAGS